MLPSYSFTTLDYNYNGQSGVWTQAWGINDLGQIVGSYSDGSPPGSEGIHGFLYNAGTYSSPLDAFTLGARYGTGADGINDAGQIVGGFANGIIDQGYLDTGGSFSFVDGSAEVFGINDSGEMVGNRASS
jgi:uncharacterized membrane protein